MSVCSSILSGGTNADCQAALSQIKSLLITDSSVSMSWATKDTQSVWANLIKQSLTIAVVPGLVNYSPTTDDPNITTSPVGKSKKVTSVGIPSFEFMLDINACDFKEMLNVYEGGNYGIFFQLEDGTIEGWMDQSGSEIGYFKPFLANVTAVTKGAQEIDSEEAFKLYVNFKRYKQVKNYHMLEPAWSADELIDDMPIGLNVLKTGAYSSGDQEVQIKIRCGANYTGLVAGDFETSTSMSNVTTPAVSSITDDGGGVYTLTVQKAVSPVNLVTGDIVYLRVKKLSGSDVTHLSGWIFVEGVT